MNILVKAVFEIIFIFIYGVYAFVHSIFRKIVPKFKKSLDGEVFLITGAGSGIGREVAIHLSKIYVKTTLVLWDNNEENIEKTLETVNFFGAKVFSYKVDVTNNDEVTKTAKQVFEDVGDVTILFNNSGATGAEDFFSQSPENIEKIIQCNLMSHFWTLKAFLPAMIVRNHGHVVTTASISSWYGLRYGAAYSASKFAIRGYMDSLRSELRHHPLQPKDVKFTTVYPWFVRTPIVSAVILKTRLQYLMDFLEPRYVAENIVEGICKNQQALFIPKFFEPVLRLKGILPQRFIDYLEDSLIEHISFEDEEDDASANSERQQKISS